MSVQKPTAIRRIEGNRGHHTKEFLARMDREPIPKGPLPKCPAFLIPAARKEWRRIVPILESMGLLTSADLSVVAGYCQSFGRWEEAEGEIKKISEERKAKGQTESALLIKTSNGNLILNPYVGVVNRQLGIMHRFAVELGFTPSARARLTIPDADKPKDDILD